MPVHPSEEEAPTGLTEKVAKDPSSSTETTASDHPGHANDHTPGGSGDGATAKATDFMSKGPQIPKSMDDMPPKASREETEAKMRELNQ